MAEPAKEKLKKIWWAFQKLAFSNDWFIVYWWLRYPICIFFYSRRSGRM